MVRKRLWIASALVASFDELLLLLLELELLLETPFSLLSRVVSSVVTAGFLLGYY
jgi:hypothetical protein